MKFQPDSLAGTNVVTRHEPGGVWVNGQPHTRSIVVPWQGAVLDWAPAAWPQLQPDHFEPLGGLGAAVVLLGTGPALRIAPPALLRHLIARGIGVECMDTAAACRTYNVLAAEGRAVVAALLVGPAGSPGASGGGLL